MVRSSSQKRKRLMIATQEQTVRNLNIISVIFSEGDLGG